jgi:4-hydroxybenzoate polyprenyltransferase
MARVERLGQQVTGYGIIYQSSGQAYTASLQKTEFNASAFHSCLPALAGKTTWSLGPALPVQLARAIHTRHRSISSFHSGVGIVTLTQRLGHYEKLMRLDKPIGILLLLWPTLWGLWLAAGGVPSTDILVIFVLGTVLMRSAGCVVNDYADRNFDSHVERTKNRPLATGKLSSKEALLLAAGLSLSAFLLILPLNRLTLALSVLALFLAASYPFTKRFFAMPQAYLGIAFSFGIPMAFAAQTGEVPYIAWLLMVANLLWVIAYDTEYAIVDKVDDLKIGIKTSAITFGRFDVVGVMLCHILFLSTMIVVGLIQKLGAIYYASLIVALGLVFYQYHLIHDRDRARCFKAFLHNNWVGAAIFVGIALDYLINEASSI